MSDLMEILESERWSRSERLYHAPITARQRFAWACYAGTLVLLGLVVGYALSVEPPHPRVEQRIGCDRPYTATMTYTFWYGGEEHGYPVRRTICA